MKKMKLIMILIIISIFAVTISTTANETTIKSLQYEVVVKDANGVTLNGKYNDENKTEKTIEVVIPQNTKVKVLYEYTKDGVLLGHVKYSTTITVRSGDTISGSTSGYGSSWYGTGNTDDPGELETNNEIPIISGGDQEGGNYNGEPDTTNQTPDNGNSNIMPDTTNPSSNYIDPYSTVGKNDTYSEMTSGSGLDTLGGNSNKYTEVKKTIEVEGDIDLSKCEASEKYALTSAINYKEARKLMIVNKNGASLYNGPAMGYGKTDSFVPAGTTLKYNYGEVPLDDTKKDVMWAYVDHSGQKGWLYINPSDSLVATYKDGRLLSFKSISVKEYPTEDSKTVETLSKDLRKSFTYIYGIQDKNNDQWYYIEYKDKKGWVKEVAKGVNAKIKVKNENGIKLYKSPSIDSDTYDTLLPNKLEIDSIYKYSKINDAFYVENDEYTGWLILEKYDDSYNFEVTYLENEVTDPLLDKETVVEKTSGDTKIKKKGLKVYQIILIIIGSIVGLIFIIAIIMKIRYSSMAYNIINSAESNDENSNGEDSNIEDENMNQIIIDNSETTNNINDQNDNNNLNS